MKKFLPWYYAGNILLAAAALAVGVAVTVWPGAWQALVGTGVASAQQGEGGNIRGWAWSGTTGWISLSSKNCEVLNQANPNTCTVAAPPVSYGVTLSLSSNGDGGELSGWAWSENMHWVCFGSACSAHGSPPDGSTLQAMFECLNDEAEQVACDAPEAVTAPVSGWAKMVSAGDGGWISLRGELDPSDELWGWTSVDFFTDDDTVKLAGWAWQYAGGGPVAGGNAYGSGWITFNPDSEIIFPYLRVEGGDVFSQGSISSQFPAPAGERNAQYLVHVGQSGSISSRFSTQCVNPADDPVCRTTGIKLNIGGYDPRSSTPYNFKLGRFDFADLAREAEPGRNKYGHEVVNSVPNFSQALAGKVYVVKATTTNLDSWEIDDYTMTLSSSSTVPNGPVNISGAGTVIVFGDLEVNANLEYQSVTSSVPRRQLASLTWIVLGDVRVNPSVEKLAGTFIVLGNRWDRGAGDSCSDRNPQGDLYEGCGVFRSGATANKSLTVFGTVFARQFKLERTYVDLATRAPAERFVSDGRMQLNPPPGMTDFSQGLPSFSRQ